jgi:hypothetical protein
VLAVTP